MCPVVSTLNFMTTVFTVIGCCAVHYWVSTSSTDGHTDKIWLRRIRWKCRFSWPGCL